jgi:nitroreductase
MELMEAIFHRRAVRAYTDRVVERGAVEILIRAAIQAPSAMNQQPWAFGVVQDVDLLARYSDRAKAHLLESLDTNSPLANYSDLLSNPDYNIFYDASTLVIICQKPGAPSAAEDCCLAAQNLMLAAHGLGLGTCPIGLARPWSDLPEVKRELGIPADYAVVFPVIVGYPAQETPPVARKEPEILFWR